MRCAMKKKLLFVYDSMMVGGTTTALLALMNGIDRTQFDISLLLFTNEGACMEELPPFVQLLPQAYKTSPIPFLDSRKRKIIRTVLNFGVFKALSSCFKYRGTPKGKFRNVLMHYGMKAQVSLSRDVAERYDIAIGFMEGWADEYVVSGKICAGKKYVWVHPQYKSCYLIPEIDKKTFRKADGIALVDASCTGQFLEFFPDLRQKVKVVPNHISAELIKKKAAAQAVCVRRAKMNFCTVCRMDVNVKGLDRVLQAFCHLKQDGYNDFLWHIIGGGTDFLYFQKMVEDMEMTENVILYGSQKNPLPYLAHMDVFLLGSRYEGKPVAVTEAQIVGIPCMVTNYQSASTQIEDLYNGRIMENSYESIYRCLKQVMEEPEIVKVWKKNTECGTFDNEKDITSFYDLLGENP